MPRKKMRTPRHLKTPPNVQKRYKAGAYSALLEGQRDLLDRAGIPHNIPAELPVLKKKGR